MVMRNKIFYSSARFMIVFALIMNQSSYLFAQTTPPSDDDTAKIQNLMTTKQFLRAGRALFETTPLNQFYNLRGYRPVWINSGQATPFASALRQMIFQLAEKHGLSASDYWTTELEAYYNGLTLQNALAFELAATRSFIQFASHLSDGQIDPTFIDNDIRLKKRVFTGYKVLVQSVSATPGVMADLVETLAPEHSYYKDSVQFLTYLNQIKSTGGFVTIKKPSVEIKLGAHHPAVPAIRQRVIQHGYDLKGTDDVYDQELSLAIQDIQKENNYLVNENLKPDSGFWTVMSPSVDQRLMQVKAQLEKLRWLPKKLESNYIFVNTNATEVSIYENNQLIQNFRTINGRVLRRTPMLRAWIARVIFNPKWTATDSIVIQDKLPMIQKDVTVLERLRMKVINRQTGQVLDPTTVDWKKDGRQLVRENLFVMDPGPKNALGVYKFPLTPDPADPKGTNSDDIYLHFTDDPSLFAKAWPRQLSSGCVRLEKAQWLAEYLLRHVPGYDSEAIQKIIAKGIPGETYSTDLSVYLPTSDIIPVYTVPLTMSKTASGKIRYMKDYYLQDRRIQQSVLASRLREDMFVKASSAGSHVVTTGLQVSGQAGPSQQFAKAVAVRCDEPTFTSQDKTGMRTIQRRCGTPVQFDLNQVQFFEPGQYILAFENTLYPGFVKVQSGSVTQIQLQKIVVPAAFSQENQIRIFRDFSTLTEQRKVYFEKFYFGRNIFRQTVRSFGDFYLASLGDLDYASSADSTFCSENDISRLQLVTDIREHAKFVCESFNQAEGMMDYADLYRFASNGTYQEAFVDYPGDVIPKKNLRYLVSTPVGPQEFVSVMPGQYRLASANGQLEQKISTTLVESYPNLKRTFANSQTGVDDDSEIDTNLLTPGQMSAQQAPLDPQAETCASNALLWRTNLRSYCVKDSAEGCQKTTAQMCQEIRLDLRFRK